MCSQRTHRETAIQIRAFVIENLKGGVLISQVMQNDAFVQHKGVGQGMFYKADNIFAENLDHSFGKVTGLPWY